MDFKKIIFALPFVAIFFGCNTKTKTEEMLPYTKDEILNELDLNGNENNPYRLFPIFDDPEVYPIASRLNLFADSTRWAIVFEQVIFRNSEPDLIISLKYFGNCLENMHKYGNSNQFESNSDFYPIWSDSYLLSILEENSFNLLSPKINNLEIQGETIAVEKDNSKYIENGIIISKFQNPNNTIDLVSIARYLAHNRPELFSASEEQIYEHLPDELPRIMVIKEWFHQDYGKPFGLPIFGEAPSTYETFQQIAEVLVSKDTTKYKPTLLPNTHWRNWKNAGKE